MKRFEPKSASTNFQAEFSLKNSFLSKKDDSSFCLSFSRSVIDRESLRYQKKPYCDIWLT